MRSCVTHDDCPRSKECVCDGECGMSCVSSSETNTATDLQMYLLNTGSRCHGLIQPQNGWIDVPPDLFFGSVATYGCISGFRLIGPRLRRCQADREWSGAQPMCKSTGRFYKLSFEN
jgi:beta-2-glycoprotein 1